MNIALSPNDPARREQARPRVALICGPTASGKSALAIALAERVGGIIVNADSAQIYRDLKLLSARPSDADTTRVPHRLFGHVDGTDDYSVARWAEQARREVEANHRDKVPTVLVGGTGLYIRTLLDGIAPVPDIEPGVRADVRALATDLAHAALRQEDPSAANRLAPTDTTRIARALEVMRSTGTPLHEWQQRRVGGIGDAIDLVALVLLPPRDWLFERCDERFADMVEHGAIDEVRALVARELDPARPVMRAIGVQQLAAYLAGDTNVYHATAAAQLATRQYAKRQFTWFRNQSPADWPRCHDVVDADLIERVADEMGTQLARQTSAVRKRAS